MGSMEMFEVGPCENGYQMGLLIGQRFSQQIRSRVASDLILQNELLPFARTPHSDPLLQALRHNNRTKFPSYWDELLGTAEGSGVPFLHVFPIFLCISCSSLLALVNATATETCLLLYRYCSSTSGRRFLLLFPKEQRVQMWIPQMTALMFLLLANLWPLQPTMRMQMLPYLATRKLIYMLLCTFKV